MTEIRTVIPDEIDRYIESLVRTGPFASKAELVRAALVAYAQEMEPLARAFDKENILSPDGRVYQLEYARMAAGRGAPGVGVVFNGGVLLASATPPEVPRLFKDVFKMRRIGDRVALLSSGLAGDAHVVAAGVKKAAPKTVDELLDAIVRPMWEHGARRDLRPLAVGFLVASSLGGEPRLFGVDPSAAYWEMDAGAIGLGHGDATALLEKKYRRGGPKEAEALALEALGGKAKPQVVVLKA